LRRLFLDGGGPRENEAGESSPNNEVHQESENKNSHDSTIREQHQPSNFTGKMEKKARYGKRPLGAKDYHILRI
jgi:hypothetical protein